MSDLLDTIRDLAKKTDSKILMVVLDGIGGLPLELGGDTELATAVTPNLDALAREAQLGQVELVGAGITPGSGPGHLSLFGYDPLHYVVGRGALSAVGIGVKLGAGDVAVRGNFATLGGNRIVDDRRAGRPSDEKNAEIVGRLREAISDIGGTPVEIYTESEHRFVVVFRANGGPALGANLSDVDPQATGVQPMTAVAHDDASQKTADLVNTFVQRAEAALKDEPQVNGVLFRGYSDVPHFPSFDDAYQLRAACIASYPMYKGLASLVGMDVLPVEGHEDALDGKVQALKDNWSKYDFFYFHVKKTDSTGEDGDFPEKVHKIEIFDELLPQLLALNPDVIAIVGDHSTPSKLATHSWHPVPLLIRSNYGRKDAATRYTEDEALKGSLGLRRGTDVMPLLMANALKLNKYGA
ncbi:2,3-bisphosphoglycerate-independent phosphoglycerate mutase [Deinococcus metalli]|uniref:Probable 2,3-bisphosphoglycerate-independent phosphoglycerate mutase n=1 Tax=Deinococcus metalli TaxID=1141878 RepID=A0A7W8KGZ3_9DEIO|nr:2,3-bisphosphoglycerate-independent phosphoglycerate mutase [Deinococcus metalli]MBB5376958.1 2,3-bisphosphoglycerate-independent phosphoglycerate mutase [Deinococcus metalli]GHF46610.1 putative 2,3-bisphosphoglycerate-independent phosphoglycerate mutase [Deinococcus metalli]